MEGKTSHRLFLLDHLKDYFADYKDASLYQVYVAFIEELTVLHFHGAVEPYQDARARGLIPHQIQVPIHEADNITRGGAENEDGGYNFTNMEL